MSVDWLNFKSCLGNFANKSIAYVDNEGNEVFIENECIFQDAIRLAKLNKKRLKLILYCKNSKENPLVENPCEFSDILPVNTSLETSKGGIMQKDSISKEKCKCNKDGPPDWFTHYMKKFKNEILHEFKSSLCDALEKVEKAKKSNHKVEANDLFCGKIETGSAASTIQIKKKKKGSERDLGDFLDQREIKLAKKNEKFHSKFERLEKLDNKTRVLLEEKQRLLEKKRHLKRIVSETAKLKKSGSFHKYEVCAFLPPNDEFVMTLIFTNNGTVSWEDPWLEFFDLNGLYPKDVKMGLPRLLPMESGVITVRGKVSVHGGFHHLKCRLFDGLQKIGPDFTCWAKVEVNGSVKKIRNAVISCKESNDKKNENSMGILIDFEKDEFAATQKKIEENINEIEKRLQDIDLFHPSNPLKDKLRNVENLKMTGDLKKNDWELLKNIEGEEKNWKEKLEQEGVHFGVDCLQLDKPSNDKMKKQKDENGKVERIEKLQKNEELESNSDSELSVVFLSEEEENFTIIPPSSENPTLAESAKDEKCENTTLRAYTESDKEKPLESLKTDVENNEEVLSISEKRQRLPDSLRYRRPPSEISKSKPKKIKQSSSEYHFTTANLTQPRFIQISEGFVEQKPFKFTGDKKQQKLPEDVFIKRTSKHIFSKGKGEEEKGLPDCVLVGRHSKLFPCEEEKEKIKAPEDEFYSVTSANGKEKKSHKVDDVKVYEIPTTDASGKIIYAVNGSGHCIPVESILKNCDNLWTATDNLNESTRGRGSGIPQGSEKRYDHFSEVSPVNVIALASRASNMASVALNTAKCVINNIHSAFATEGKTEVGKPTNENGKKNSTEVSMEALYHLLEMGFTDCELNQRLLLTHGNNVRKVVDQLIQMQSNSSWRSA